MLPAMIILIEIHTHQQAFIFYCMYISENTLFLTIFSLSHYVHIHPSIPENKWHTNDEFLVFIWEIWMLFCAINSHRWFRSGHTKFLTFWKRTVSASLDHPKLCNQLPLRQNPTPAKTVSSSYMHWCKSFIALEECNAMRNIIEGVKHYYKIMFNPLSALL